jgi:hypothetical protein
MTCQHGTVVNVGCVRRDEFRWITRRSEVWDTEAYLAVRRSSTDRRATKLGAKGGPARAAEPNPLPRLPQVRETLTPSSEHMPPAAPLWGKGGNILCSPSTLWRLSPE